jgi:hypothetical protein
LEPNLRPKTSPGQPSEIPEEEIVRWPFAALQAVPSSGVEWWPDFFQPQGGRRRGDDHGPGPWLIPRQRREWDLYAPLARRRSGLHRRFSRLRGADAIARFASRYGLLGHSETGVVGGTLQPEAESLGRWMKEVAAMREVLMQWDLVRRREPSRAAAVATRQVSAGPFGGRAGIDPDRFRVTKAINDRLAGHLAPVAHPKRAGQVLLWPDCLLAALWLQLQLELERDREPARPPKRCRFERDGVHFLPDDRTARMEFCPGGSCRKKYHYDRQNATATLSH